MNKLKIYDIAPIPDNPWANTESAITKTPIKNDKVRLPSIFNYKPSIYTTLDIVNYRDNLNELFEKISPNHFKVNKRKPRQKLRIPRQTKDQMWKKPVNKNQQFNRSVRPFLMSGLSQSGSLSYLQEFIKKQVDH